ncbi:hypothetical protein D8Y22_09640 [Salinadaptatus halalkaliphilus]|uniref:Uncharacterized protein n=1 Tax=Salinadaptatus halalkaliphilus TaxID=2419781 RepID=A0A4S3TS35_9EURY|nr:hypothetical protein D8Y22_09640 [Salinadaptatus halalkaliphilus]
MRLVRDGDVKPPLAVFVNDFGGSNPPLVVFESGSHPVEMIGATAKFAFDVVSWGSTDTEPNRILVFNEQSVAFPVVHHQWVQLVDVWVGSAPPVVFVVEVGFDLAKCFVNKLLAGVLDVVSVIHDDRFEIVPIPPVAVETVDFVADAAGFETSVSQVVRTPRVDV